LFINLTRLAVPAKVAGGRIHDARVAALYLLKESGSFGRTTAIFSASSEIEDSKSARE
jgi:hypothetical protein